MGKFQSIWTVLCIFLSIIGSEISGDIGSLSPKQIISYFLVVISLYVLAVYVIVTGDVKPIIIGITTGVVSAALAKQFF